MQQWFHPIDGSVRQQSGEYPHFFLQKKKKRVLLCSRVISSNRWLRQLSGEYPHFFLQVLGVPSSFFALQGGGQFFFVSANLPIPTNWTSNSRSPVSVYRSGLKKLYLARCLFLTVRFRFHELERYRGRNWLNHCGDLSNLKEDPSNTRGSLLTLRQIDFALWHYVGVVYRKLIM